MQQQISLDEQEATYNKAVALYERYCEQEGFCFQQPSKVMSDQPSRNVVVLTNASMYEKNRWSKNSRALIARVNVRNRKVNGVVVIRTRAESVAAVHEHQLEREFPCTSPR